jgi:hypothetical protein
MGEIFRVSSEKEYLLRWVVIPCKECKKVVIAFKRMSIHIPSLGLYQ